MAQVINFDDMDAVTSNGTELFEVIVNNETIWTKTQVATDNRTWCVDHYLYFKYNGAGQIEIAGAEPSGAVHYGRGDCAGYGQGWYTPINLNVSGYDSIRIEVSSSLGGSLDTTISPSTVLGQSTLATYGAGGAQHPNITVTATVTKTPSNQYIFTSSGTFIMPSGYSSAVVTIVAGGGGGGGAEGYGGGGGGGYQDVSYLVIAGASIPIIVGAGGNPGKGDANGGNDGSPANCGGHPGNGCPGGTSSFGSYLSASGGGGGSHIQDGYAGAGGSPGGSSGGTNVGNGNGAPGGASQGGQGSGGVAGIGAYSTGGTGGSFGGGGGGGGWQSGQGGYGAPGYVSIVLV
jgi:hypothetical protein